MGDALRKTLSGPGALRLMLALAVFAHHLSRWSVGAAAVDVFFVLSGFWVCRMWTERYSRAEHPYLTYIVSRFWRLLPVFVLFAGAFLAIAVARGYPLTAHALASSALILGYDSLPHLPLAPAWSLDIEAQFYLLAPALIVAATRVRSAVILTLAAAVVAAAAWGRDAHGLVTPYLVFFAIGICAARVDVRPDRRVAFAGLGLGALIGAILVLSPWRDVALGGANPGPLHRFNDLYNLALAACVAPYALWTTGNRMDGRGAARDGMFADLSYVVYLAHWGACMWLAQYAVGGSGLRRLALTAAAVAVTLVGSWVVWRFYDRPINNARARWVKSRLIKAAAIEPHQPAAQAA